VELRAPAKVNLWLHVLERMDSGYHSLESLFCAISLHDVIRVEHADAGIGLDVAGGVDTGPPEQNLVVRAASSFCQEIGARPALRIRLEKRIPSAAGLGGGSSDAAATLRALNVLYGDPVPATRLVELGAALGSDVPFFLCGSPLALGWGRGERLLALPPLPERPVLVVHPGEAVPTSHAFRELARRRAGEGTGSARSVALAWLGDWSDVAALAANDFEPVAMERIPRLAAAREAMLAAGAEIALLAGSGGSCFGVFAEARDRDAAASAVRAQGFAAWTVHTIDALPDPVSG
jgi:4-diphosphocytidyl-2-C-methyl-D-erythritol kinase